MSSIIRHTDKRTGIVYCYESVSYWDKELKQPRSRRRLIGKIDPETGEMVPTGGKGRPRKEKKEDQEAVAASRTEPADEFSRILSEKNREIEQLKSENRRLAREKADMLKKMQDIIELYSDRG